jgi:ABC-type Zn uptake system ZnuABC Zn-binding protein ZnuA
MQSADIDLDLKVPFSENVLHETGSAHMVELIEEIELHGVKNVFTEPQFSDGNLQKFAQQYNLTVATLDPLGTNPSANGYLENLKINLDNLSLIYE